MGGHDTKTRGDAHAVWCCADVTVDDDDDDGDDDVTLAARVWGLGTGLQFLEQK